MTCRHLRLRESEKLGKLICIAFPAGIPREIIVSEHDHREPHPDDGGIQYEAQSGMKEEG